MHNTEESNILLAAIQRHNRMNEHVTVFHQGRLTHIATQMTTNYLFIDFILSIKYWFNRMKFMLKGGATAALGLGIARIP